MRFSLLLQTSYLAKRPAILLKSSGFIDFCKSIRNMSIKEGSSLPNVSLYDGSPANKVQISDLCKNKTVVFFAVPGAFTPGCSKTHLPGYVSKADELRAKGIDEIVCVAVNDPFVMDAWGKSQGTEGKVKMLADPCAEFTKAIGLDIDIAPLGGVRSKRYSMVVKDGVVQTINVEPDGTGLSCSLADHLKPAA